MDHPPIPESCLPQARPVPYLSLTPAYDRKGLEGFPSGHGIGPDQLISLSEEAVSMHKI
jgi:hypothetical protein